MKENEMIHTGRVLIVEGKYDAARLSHLTDAMILLTDGFGIYKDKKRQQLFKALAQKNGISLGAQCDDISIVGSDALIYRLLFNLIENGIKYNTPGGSVHITIRQKKSSAVLRVADTGCGIPEEYRTSVFQPFFRVDKSRSREMGGVGLGLALVREIALLHGGTVTAEPADGHGTVFTVTLPIQA